MILVCPSCAATHSAEAWSQDAAIRETIAAVVKLPRDVQEHLFEYLALFRPPKRALSWRRARRVVGELAELVAAREVGWETLPPRPATPALWAHGMGEMIGRKAGFKAHFTAHNYLKKIVYDLADEADREAEKRTRQAEARHERPDEAGLPDMGLSPEEMARNRKEFFEAVGRIGRKIP